MPDHEARLAEAISRYRSARGDRDKAIRAAHKAGLSYRTIGGIVGLSYARVAQICRGE